MLGRALIVTVETTLLALLLAVLGGGFAAVVLAQSRWIEMLMSPILVTLQLVALGSHASYALINRIALRAVGEVKQVSRALS